MKSLVFLGALLAVAVAKPQILLARLEDDGQWRPELDNSFAGFPNVATIPIALRKKRSHPADEPIVAIAKQQQLIQQNTEGARNILGSFPRDLPADTVEVAAAKQAHAIAHAREVIRTSPRLPFNQVNPVAAFATRASVSVPFGYPYNSIAPRGYSTFSPYTVFSYI